MVVEGTATSSLRSLVVSGLVNQPLYSGPQFLCIGNDGGINQVSATDQALFTEVGQRISGTLSQITTTTSGDTYQWEGTLLVSEFTHINNFGLISSSGSPIQDTLAQQVSSRTQSYISPTNFNIWPSPLSNAYNIQVNTEVMTITGTNGIDTLYVQRGVNGSIPLELISAGTTITQVNGILFQHIRSSFPQFNNGDTIQFTIQEIFQ
jgi:hypothetical protein